MTFESFTGSIVEATSFLTLQTVSNKKVSLQVFQVDVIELKIIPEQILNYHIWVNDITAYKPCKNIHILSLRIAFNNLKCI